MTSPPPPKKKKIYIYIHKIFILQKIFIFLKNETKNVEIQNVEPKKKTRAYVCMK